VHVPIIKGCEESISCGGFGKKPKLLVSQDLADVKMREDVLVDNSFQSLADNRLQRNGTVISNRVTITGLEDGNDPGEFPCTRCSTCRDGKIENLAQDR